MILVKAEWLRQTKMSLHVILCRKFKVLAECALFFRSAGALPASLFLAGLVGGVTHCAGMCGPFVVAQSGSLERFASSMLLPYHAGRMTTYVALAVLTNSVLNIAFAASPLKSLFAAPMLALAGAAFLVTAFPKLSALLPWAVSFRISLPYRWISNVSAFLLRGPGALKRYALGVLLGFMPCGLVLSALLAAATAENAYQSALAMAAFAVGTVPALFMVTISGHSLKVLFPRSSGYAFRGLMVFNGLWLMAMAGFLIG